LLTTVHHDDARELQVFHQLQQRLRPVLDAAPDRGPQTIVVVPSVTLDGDGLLKISGPNRYEERLLFLLQLLRQPQTRLVYITGKPMHPTVIEYALDLVASLPNWHGRRRLTILDCGDDGPAPLTQKILQRPDLLNRIRQSVPDPAEATLVTFTSTPLERSLAVQLGLPLYACDPALTHFGSKSGARRIFQEAGVPVLDGFADLRDEGDVIKALAELRIGDPQLRRAIIKLNESFGAGGNALFCYDGAPESGLDQWIGRELARRAEFASPPDSWENYAAKLVQMGAMVERYAETATRSPSAQVEIRPDGTARVFSTHDQVFAGAAEQIFAGGSFPADPEYRLDIQELALRAGQVLAAKSVTGPLSIDLLSERVGPAWRHYGLEINMRMGGGTAPYYLLHGLVEGHYAPESGEYLAPGGEPRCSFATDRLMRAEYRTLGPEQVIDGALRAGLHFSTATRSGVAFYMLGALAEVGKLGVISIDRTPEAARALHQRVVTMLDAAV
jgi:hypothetical protein